MPARVIGGYRGAAADHESNRGKHAYAPSPDKDGLALDTLGVAPLIEGLEFDAFIADTAFDSNDIIADLHRRGARW